ncbi:gamma-glutamylcyclotransferase [Trinickia terrae]|uniref:Gamma-glutamylcyclotransferase n=1 Tax=Trinickia terrae TaxID=2571161 RepID=A0A4U1HMX2_9BURK|nr:gamma-glutamylcyclotransferase family protein [Trinickia terrae]TKC82659.1 gamma-glutamylcyclotransferase [Trinickia terrae]
MQYVFVYGTLRAGEINDIGRAAARHGIAEPRFIGAAAVSGQLYDFGNYPGLVPYEVAASVRGDVYQIDSALVPVLDEIEEVYPGVEGLFRARQAMVAVDGREYACLFYPVAPGAAAGRLRIESGDWVEYRIARDALASVEERKYGS